MNHGQFSRLTQVRRSTLVAAGLYIATFQICGWSGLRINVSPSLPVGLYVTTGTGKLVEFCPSEPFAHLALARGYRNAGVCPDGGAPLMKPIVASTGDQVDFSARGFAVNGMRIPKTAPLVADTKGRPLSHWAFGRYAVPAGVVWVASSYNPRSFDSRYFGPVPVTTLRSHLRPILTF